IAHRYGDLLLDRLRFGIRYLHFKQRNDFALTLADTEIIERERPRITPIRKIIGSFVDRRRVHEGADQLAKLSLSDARHPALKRLASCLLGGISFGDGVKHVRDCLGRHASDPGTVAAGVLLPLPAEHHRKEGYPGVAHLSSGAVYATRRHVVLAARVEAAADLDLRSEE